MAGNFTGITVNLSPQDMVRTNAAMQKFGQPRSTLIRCAWREFLDAHGIGFERNADALLASPANSTQE